MPKFKLKLKVKTAKPLTEREALALLQTAQSKGSGFMEAIKNEIFTRVSRNEHQGLVVPSGINGEEVTEDIRRQTVTQLNSDFRKRDFQYGVRWVPSQSGLVYAPNKMLETIFGKKD